MISIEGAKVTVNAHSGSLLVIKCRSDAFIARHFRSSGCTSSDALNPIWRFVIPGTVCVVSSLLQYQGEMYFVIGARIK